MTLLSEPIYVKTTANIATALFAFFIVTQLLVASGILPVTMLWGGRQTELTLSLRLTSIAATVILGAFIYIIRYRAGLVATPTPNWIRIGAWIVTAYMALNTAGNFTSVSNTERFLFGPLAVVMTISCLFVALSDINGEL